MTRTSPHSSTPAALARAHGLVSPTPRGDGPNRRWRRSTRRRRERTPAHRPFGYRLRFDSASSSKSTGSRMTTPTAARSAETAMVLYEPSGSDALEWWWSRVPQRMTARSIRRCLGVDEQHPSLQIEPSIKSGAGRPSSTHARDAAPTDQGQLKTGEKLQRRIDAVSMQRANVGAGARASATGA